MNVFLPRAAGAELATDLGWTSFLDREWVGEDAARALSGTVAIAVFYSRQRLPAFCANLRRFADALGVKALIAVLNGEAVHETDIRQALRGSRCALTVVRHNNTGAEFGAYQRGLDVALTRNPDFCVFINDTAGIHQHLGWSFVLALRARLHQPGPPKWCFGITQMAERRFSLFGLSGTRWVQSHFFAIDRAGLAALRNRVYVPELNEMIRETGNPDEFFAPPVEQTLRAHLSSWLFGTSGHRWYRAAPLAAGNAAVLSAKARSILQEKYLSMRMDEAALAFYLPRACIRRRALEKLQHMAFQMKKAAMAG